MVTRGAVFCRMTSAATLVSVGAAILSTCLFPTEVEARHKHFAHHGSHHYQSQLLHHHRHGFRPHYVRARFAPAGDHIAAIVVDANSGHTLYARNENDLRHPASITKVMTLYLLFERLEKGQLSLDSEIPISAHAAMQKPTKLGLRRGQTISVDSAIKAVVTRSANDIAVAIAEAIGGDEQSFAAEMTARAHALGMSRTHFENASGLPNDEQVTTAHDLAILGRAIQERFPRYYHYFSTHVFTYAGRPIQNHNHLMERVEGMDGIKTGYTQASGFNLLSSVKRDGHYIIGVVLGGASAASRDRVMENLIADQIDNSATSRMASAIGSGDEHMAEAEPQRPQEAFIRTPVTPREEISKVQPPQQKFVNRVLSPADSTKPAAHDQATDLLTPVQLASLNPEASSFKPRPAFISGTPKAEAGDEHAVKAHRSNADGSTASSTKSPGPATPSNIRAADRRSLEALATEPNPKSGPRSINSTPEALRPEPAKSFDAGRPASARTGWMIQIGATDDADKAEALLTRAKTEGRKALSLAHPFTEKIQKGSETLYRARFAGLEENSAENACQTLKRSGFSCFATKN